MNIINATTRFKPKPKPIISLYSLLIKDPSFQEAAAKIQDEINKAHAKINYKKKETKRLTLKS